MLSKKTANKLRELMQDRDGPLPVWVRARVGQREYFTGLSRSKFYELAASGSIRSVSLREPGQVKGVRLFELASILKYIERCAAANAEAVPVNGAEVGSTKGVK
jgi:hypothetical protein